MHEGWSVILLPELFSRPKARLYREDLKLADMVEPLGFDSIWGVEHHFSPYTMIPDVLQFLTYMAGRTTRVGFGSMVVVLPWHDPVRVAEQIAMLDIYACDRELTLGFGRGSGRIEYDGFRVSMSESRDRFTEAAEIVTLGLTQERFSYKGKFFNIPEMSIRPRAPHKNLTDRFYGAIASPETGDIMAKLGMGMLVIPQKGWEGHAADYEHFRNSCIKFGQTPKRPIALSPSSIADAPTKKPRLAPISGWAIMPIPPSATTSTTSLSISATSRATSTM